MIEVFFSWFSTRAEASPGECGWSDPNTPEYITLHLLHPLDLLALPFLAFNLPPSPPINFSTSRSPTVSYRVHIQVAQTTYSLFSPYLLAAFVSAISIHTHHNRHRLRVHRRRAYCNSITIHCIQVRWWRQDIGCLDRYSLPILLSPLIPYITLSSVDFPSIQPMIELNRETTSHHTHPTIT